MKKDLLINGRRDFLSNVLVYATGGSLALVSISGCSNSSNSDESPSNNSDEAPSNDVEDIGIEESVDDTIEEEKADDIASFKDEIFYIYQEEKVARDVYITLGKRYRKENTFASIQTSEQRHIDSARGLCEKYNIDISNVKETKVGNFVLPVLQDMYDTCIALGSESLLDALKVGEFIELTDIKDLSNFINNPNMPDDAVRVFEQLREGSYNHLEAYRRAISRESK